jgi:methyl-accepting chemotaxis protein
MKVANMKIGVRLVVLAAFLMITMVFVGAQGWRSLKGNNEQAVSALAHATLMENMVDTARHAQVRFKIQIQEWKNTLLRGGDPASFEKYRQAFIEEGAATQADLQKLQGMMVKANLDTSSVDGTLKSHAELQRKYLEALKRYDTGQSESAHVVDAAVKGMDRGPTKQIDDIVAYVLNQAHKTADDTTARLMENYNTGNMLLLSIILLAAAAGSAATVWIIRTITTPLSMAVKIAQTVATGDLTSDIEVTSKDETGQLLQALKDMNENLARIVTEVRHGTDAMAGASSQIATGNMDLSSRTEQQAGSLEETASSMEELTNTVKQNAENARQANGLAMSASTVASKGGAVVSEVVQTMGSINESAKKIVDIISVIDGIAFQTNILALNAAVEAARAGEQGRGFAVVATEVRNLAQRSAGAAKEIKALIGNSVEQVEAGSRLVGQAGTTMDEVVESVKRVSDIISEITAASQEQTAGIEQINIAISQMDETTQQNASLVEQAAAAAQALLDQAGRLSNAVGAFKTDRDSDVSVMSEVQAVSPRRLTLPAASAM